jgi:sodium pump decarboxylase gamma subunit
MVKRNMKKLLSVLCICICLLGVAGCQAAKPVSQEDKEIVVDYSQFLTQYLLAEDADMYAYFFQGQITSLDDFTKGGAEFTESVLGQIGLKVEGNGFVSGIESWKKAKEEIGNLVSINGSTVQYGSKGDTLIVDVDAQFEKRDATIEFVYKDDLNKTLTSYAVNVNYTFGEKMKKAGLNTLMGMGTVFIVLILLSFVISCFGYINKAQAAADSKKRAELEAEEARLDKPAAEPVEAAEASYEENDDELAAVIAAAIAAYEAENGGAVTPEQSGGYYVRSIRRRSTNKW